MEIFDILLQSATSIFSFIQSIPSMIIQFLGGFPPSLVSILLAGFLAIIAIRFLELVF